MEFDARTKVDDLLKEYPFLMDFLVSLKPAFKALKNPIMRKTMGKVATLKQVAAVGEMSLDTLISVLETEIENQAGKSAAADPGGAVSNESISDPEVRQALLKGIIKDLHDGEDMEVLKERFGKLVQGVDAVEVSKMEQSLIDEGLPAEEIKRLCDVHVELFKEALEEQDRPDPPMGHPVHTFMKENRISEAIISDISILMGELGVPPTNEAFEKHGPELKDLIEHLSEINILYTRKENQLFPMLEAHHFTGPSQVMWSIHDDIRAWLKQARESHAAKDPVGMVNALQEATRAIRDMIYKDEHILFPTSLDMLSEDEWIKIQAGEADIGYAWITPDEGWPGELKKEPASEPSEPKEAVKDVAGALGLDTGQMTLEQINLLLTHLPVDLTLVDENDRVAYYSEGPERIFPRSPAIIGREVRNCHPPKSVHVVNKILDEFKAGSKSTAEFWLELGGRFIYIRYFAVRDSQGHYRGTLEVSQDLTEIRRLEGEQRLLDWD